MRASDYIGRIAYDSDGRRLGWIADLVVEAPPDDVPAITHVVVSRRRARLFGYERAEIQGPWVIARLARWIQGPVRQLQIQEVRLTAGPRPRPES